MELPRFSPGEIAFLLVVPVAWAILLVFHPAVGDPVYDSLEDEATAFYVVHLGMLVFIGLIGAALDLLVRQRPGTAAKVSRLAIGPPALLCFAGAVALLARGQRAPAVSAPTPASDT